jgi:VanZ family protein
METEALPPLLTVIARLVGNPWLRALGVFCVGLIVFLSLIPGSWQERTPLPGPVEHFIAYAGTATILLLAARRRPRTEYYLLVLALLSAFSGLMEELQHFSPGRDPQIIGFVASSLGALAGTVFAWGLRRIART